MTTKLVNDNTEAFYRISQLYYQLGEEEDSLRYIRMHFCITLHIQRMYVYILLIILHL